MKRMLGLLLVLGMVGCGVAELEKFSGKISPDGLGRITVTLENTRVSDAELVHLKGPTGLKALTLTRTKVADAGLPQT